MDGKLLRLDGSESLASSRSDNPRPSDDLRKRKIPLISRARLPSAKTRGTVVNCTSEGEKIQKQKAATASAKYTTARRGCYSKSPARFSTKISRSVTAHSLYQHGYLNPLVRFPDLSGVIPELAPVAAPSIFDLLFSIAPIVGGRDQGQCAVDTKQDHGSDFNDESRVPVHLAPALEDLIRAMDNPPTLEPIPFSKERIDDIDFDRGVVLDVLNRLR